MCSFATNDHIGIKQIVTTKFPLCYLIGMRYDKWHNSVDNKIARSTAKQGTHLKKKTFIHMISQHIGVVWITVVKSIYADSTMNLIRIVSRAQIICCQTAFNLCRTKSQGPIELPGGCWCMPLGNTANSHKLFRSSNDSYGRLSSNIW